MFTVSDRPAMQEFDIEQLLAPVFVDNPVGEDLRRMVVGKLILMADI